MFTKSGSRKRCRKLLLMEGLQSDHQSHYRLLFSSYSISRKFTSWFPLYSSFLPFTPLSCQHFRLFPFSLFSPPPPPTPLTLPARFSLSDIFFIRGLSSFRVGKRLCFRGSGNEVALFVYAG